MAPRAPPLAPAPIVRPRPRVRSYASVALAVVGWLGGRIVAFPLAVIYPAATDTAQIVEAARAWADPTAIEYGAIELSCARSGPALACACRPRRAPRAARRPDHAAMAVGRLCCRYAMLIGPLVLLWLLHCYWYEPCALARRTMHSPSPTAKPAAFCCSSSLCTPRSREAGCREARSHPLRARQVLAAAPESLSTRAPRQGGLT